MIYEGRLLTSREILEKNFSILRKEKATARHVHSFLWMLLQLDVVPGMYV